MKSKPLCVCQNDGSLCFFACSCIVLSVSVCVYT